MINYRGLNWFEVLRSLKEEYPLIAKHPERHPPKNHYTMQTDGIADIAFVNAMSAQLSDMTVSNKLIYVNDRTGKMVSSVAYCLPDGDILHLDGEALTAYRCGAMAALAMNLWGVNGAVRVGLIGYGRINQATLHVLKARGLVSSLVISGSAGRPRKYDNPYPSLSVDFEEGAGYLPALASCDVIISATSALTEGQTLQARQLDRVPLVIAQDMGYMFGPSFRKERISFADYPAQLHHAFKTEFPYDNPLDLSGFHSLTHPRYAGERCAVYLYGVAMADAVVAREVSRQLVTR